MARASKEADRLRRLCERSMKSPEPGAPPGASAAAGGLASFDAPFFTRSTARGVLAAVGGLGEARTGVEIGWGAAREWPSTHRRGGPGNEEDAEDGTRREDDAGPKEARKREAGTQGCC